ncbi:MAG: membrane dipeptidase [Proteobacteria bacterium]|nr:membrane dipeptidase [Pseudomonadota bacterium]
MRDPVTAPLARRTLLSLAGAAALAPSASFAKQLKRPEPAPPVYDRSIVIDAQGGVFDDGPFNADEKFRPALAEVLRTSGVTVVSTTVNEVGNGPDRFRSAVSNIADADRLFASNADLLMPILSGADIVRAKREKKVGLILNFQDTTPLETDPANVGLFRGLGVRIIQLTYNKRNLCGDGSLEVADAGLSDLGRQMIAEINAKRVLLDLSHAGRRTMAEGAAASKAPPAITHTGARALADNPRNSEDSTLKLVADKGGVCGVYMMPFLKPGVQPHSEHFLAHLEHFIQVCGEDHVGIGTDGGVPPVKLDAAYWEQQRKFVADRKAKGISAPGESGDIANVVMEYNTPRRLETLAFDLSKRGHSDARIEKILGANFARLFGEVWG